MFRGRLYVTEEKKADVLEDLEVENSFTYGVFPDYTKGAYEKMEID